MRRITRITHVQSRFLAPAVLASGFVFGAGISQALSQPGQEPGWVSCPPACPGFQKYQEGCFACCRTVIGYCSHCTCTGPNCSQAGG